MPYETEELAPAGGRSGDDEVVRWRRARLVRAGYDEESARELAAAADVDLHRAIELLHRGCPPELAVRILV